MPDRLLAAAVSYQSALEPRPYRPALDPRAAAQRLRDRVRSGELDPVAVDAVLNVAGHRSGRPGTRPDGLTPREKDQVIRVEPEGTGRFADSLDLHTACFRRDQKIDSAESGDIAGKRRDDEESEEESQSQKRHPPRGSRADQSLAHVYVSSKCGAICSEIWTSISRID